MEPHMLFEGSREQPRKSPEDEFVESAALQYKGELFLGKNHAVALESLDEAHPNLVAKDVLDGFVTSTGRFVDREEAYRIAKKQNQVSEDRPPRTDEILDSEHLKPKH